MNNSTIISEGHCLCSGEGRVSAVNHGQLRKGSQVFNTEE